MSSTRLAVWGDPIAHSLSPALHAAAYRELGLDWQYERRQVTAADFAATVQSLDSTWRGLSLTMPLKEEGFRLAVHHDSPAQLTGAVNTLVVGDEPAGFNTDVGGIVDALAEAGITAASSARILGAGATAASALVALADLGATRVEVRARRPEPARALTELAQRLGVDVIALPFDAPTTPVDLTIATLPSGTVLPREVAEPLAAAGGALFDAAYAPWPSALARAWGEATVVSGLGMLLHQAVRQIRIFTQGDPAAPVPQERAVISAMRAAL